MIKIISVVTARPNFIKIALLAHAVALHNEDAIVMGAERIEHDQHGD